LEVITKVLTFRSNLYPKISNFDKSKRTFIGSEHPRENKDYPKVGIFAQRKKDRPNHIGATIVNLVS